VRVEMIYSVILDDGHMWLKHVLILTLKNIHLLYNIRVVFLTTLPPS